MPAPCRQKPISFSTRIALWTLTGIGLGMVLVVFAGCGSVGDIGMGASRSGVQPVRGTYGTSGYSGLSGDQEQRLERIAKANRKGKQESAALKKLKALPDGASDTVATATVAERPAPAEGVKIAVIGSDRTPSSSSTRSAASSGAYGGSAGYGSYGSSSRGRGYDDY